MEYEDITEGERSPACVESSGLKLRVYLLPFFGDKLLKEITPGLVQEYRAHRATSRKDKDGNPLKPARSTLHQETILLRHMLKTAERHHLLCEASDTSAGVRITLGMSVLLPVASRNSGV